MSSPSDSASPPARVLRFASGCGHEPIRGGPGVIRSTTGSLNLPPLAVAFERLLSRLPLATDAVTSEAAGIGPPALETLLRLAELRVIEDVVVGPSGDDRAVARRPHIEIGRRAPGKRVRLGEHIFVRLGRAEWVVQRPSTFAVIALEAGGAGATLRDLAAGIESEALTEVGNLFLDNHFLVGDGEPDESDWEFHDALFHAVSAHGHGTEGGYGATSARAAKLARSSRKSPSHAAGHFVDLADPELGASASIAEVLARRRTRREFCPGPIPLETLDSLLRLALRTQSTFLSSNDYGALHPYPSGGARDEVMTVVARTGDLQGHASLAVYMNHEHRLLCFHDSQQQALEVIEVLSETCGVRGSRPGAALLFAADYERMAARYEAIAYATILRNVGAIYQTVSLVAESLGLASCVVGGGWGRLERRTLSVQLAGRVIVGGILVGLPAGAPPL